MMKNARKKRMIKLGGGGRKYNTNHTIPIKLETTIKGTAKPSNEENGKTNIQGYGQTKIQNTS